MMNRKFTKAEKTLIADLCELGQRTETINLVLSAMTTEKLQIKMNEMLIQRYQQKGQVTEEDVLKMIIVLTRPKKKTDVKP